MVPPHPLAAIVCITGRPEGNYYNRIIQYSKYKKSIPMSPGDVKGFIEQGSLQGELNGGITGKSCVDTFATKLVFFDIRNFPRTEA
jgi:hypothetical protein